MQKKLLTPLVGILFLILIFSINEIRTKKVINKVHKEYPSFSIGTRQGSRISRIIYKLNSKMFRDDPNSSYITFVDSTKRRIKTTKEIFSKGYFDDLVRTGDSLSKMPGTDIITIFRIHNGDTVRYSFKLENDQHYPLK